MTKAEVIARLEANGVEVPPGTTGSQNELVAVFYNVTGATVTFSNGATEEHTLNEFHIVASIGGGANAVSKNGAGSIVGPGPIDSFPPTPAYSDALPPGTTVEYDYTTTWYTIPID